MILLQAQTLLHACTNTLQKYLMFARKGKMERLPGELTCLYFHLIKHYNKRTLLQIVRRWSDVRVLVVCLWCNTIGVFSPSIQLFFCQSACAKEAYKLSRSIILRLSIGFLCQTQREFADLEIFCQKTNLQLPWPWTVMNMIGACNPLN